MGKGDALASGARSATFGPAKVTQEKWDAIWVEDVLCNSDISTTHDRKIKENKARCKGCKTVIESRSVHDYVSCACGAISVDGGREYLRRIGNLELVEELSTFE